MNNYNDDLIKNYDITEQLIQNNISNQDNFIRNYIDLIINNTNYNNSYIYRNNGGSGGGGGGYGGNINVYNNYQYDKQANNKLVTDTSINTNNMNERFHDYYRL